ncbi:hypothetical protein R3P38DRAFT_2921300 [Favolaschia claudopus]|uniref:Uncharacterized protein n=1 Tax=Favolaschia claudopus TaxID=2862362 RepID=A0AAW0C246_9AGAR
MPAPSNDPLAAQLNDLAIANSEGLLNDDEYRLLRQNLFERYTGGVEIVSVHSPTPVKPVPAPPRRIQKHVELVATPLPRAPPISPPTSPRSRISGVAGLLRRATGRSKSSSPAPPASPSPGVIKLNLIPRMFSKKADDALSSDTESSSAGTRHSSSRSLSRKGSTGDLDLSGRPRPSGLSSPVSSPTHSRGDPTSPSSPSRANFDTGPKSPSRSTFATTSSTPSKYDVIPGGSNDIFDDENLSTSEAIRTAIAAVEAEGRRLIVAFNDLETSAVIRYRREHQPRRRSGTTPPPTTPRRPALSPLPVPGSSSSNSSHTPNRSRSNSYRADAQSIRSNSSLRTTKSIGSLLRTSDSTPPPPAFSQSTPPQATSPSAWTARLPSLRKKGSESSLASSNAAANNSNSFLSPGAQSPSTLSRTRSSSMSRSTGHLPLPPPIHRHGSGSTMMELLNSTQPPPGEGGEELTEVRRRRAEMIGRCEARIDYLRAKLKAQEIHEKLLRK